MQVNEIMDLARSQTHTTATQFPNATVIVWLNLVYKKLIRRIITEVDENYFTATGQIDAVANQSSYSLGTNMINLKSVKVLPTPDATDYEVSTEIDFSVQPYDYEYYANNQPNNFYRHQIIGTSLWLAPRFDTDTAGTAGNNQIVYTYEQAQADLSVGGAESTITIPVDFHYVIALGLKPYFYAAIGKTGEKNDAIMEFNLETDTMEYLLRGRDDTANHLSLPNDNILQ